MLALQRTVGNARVSSLLSGRATLARANATDPRLPANQAEGLAHASASAGAVGAALSGLSSAADLRERNVPALVTQEGLTVRALTPRHDSTLASAAAPHPPINFFPGSSSYAGSIVLADDATHSTNATRTLLSIRARDHANVDTLLSAADLGARIVEAVSEVAHTRAARQAVGSLTTLDRYKGRFNALFPTPPFAGLSDGIDTTLSSRGPKTARSRRIFEAIHDEDPAFATAYDANTGGIKEQVDRYQGPEGLNLLNSPGLQRLRAAFFSAAVPVPAAGYAAFKTSIATVAQTLTTEDRAEVDRSNDWQLLLDRHVTTAARRDEIKNIIRTATPPVVGPGPGAGPGPGPPPPPAGAVTPQSFIDSVTLLGPAAPVPATGPTEAVPLTPQSTQANPNVSISAQTTVTPAASVRGPNVSPATAWPNGATSAPPFSPTIAVTGPVTLDAQLALVNAPAGLTRAAPIAPVRFTIDDRRQANVGTNWRPGLRFNGGAFQIPFVPGSSTPRYVGGSQTINVEATMPVAPSVNPGLTLSIEARIERGGAIIAPAQVAPWQPAAASSGRVTFTIAPPAAIPAGGDAVSVVTRLLDAGGAQVSVRSTPMTIGPPATYSQVAAETEWNNDEAHLHNAAAGGFVAFLAAGTGSAPGLANLIDRPGHSGPVIIHPMIERHDSAAYVAAENGGVPDPSRSAYVIAAPPYAPHPDPAHTIVLATGAGGWRIGSAPPYPGAFILLSRTPDVTLGVPRRSDGSVAIVAIHEATHFMDRGIGGTPFDSYKTEFRAYWMDGRFGPPDVAVPASPSHDPAVFTPGEAPPGPKSPRAKRIFRLMYDNPVLYPFCKPNYDANVGGFREQVDSYLVPDGVNLILSAQVEALRVHFAAGLGAGFAGFRTAVQGFFGVGPPPAGGALSVPEKDYIAGTRDWRDKVDGLAGATAAMKATLKADMGIP